MPRRRLVLQCMIGTVAVLLAVARLGFAPRPGVDLKKMCQNIADSGSLGCEDAAAANKGLTDACGVLVLQMQEAGLDPAQLQVDIDVVPQDLKERIVEFDSKCMYGQARALAQQLTRSDEMALQDAVGVFGATASTSVSGALAEPSKAPPRNPHISAAQLDAYFNYFAAIATFIYPWIVHMTWAYGWMSNLHLPDLPFE